MKTKFASIVVLAFVLFFAASCGSDGVPANQQQPKVGDVEMLREGMQKSCSLTVNQGHMAWVEVANGDVLMECAGYGGPIYQSHVDDHLGQPTLMGRGTNPALNEQGRLGYIELDQVNRCARARLDDREIANNCDTFQGNPHYASTSFSGANFVFTLQKDFSESRLYHYNGREVRKDNRPASFAQVVGAEIAFVEGRRDQNNIPYQRGMITALDGVSVLEFGYGNGPFKFTRDRIAYTASENDGSGDSKGHIYVMNRIDGYTYRFGQGTRVGINNAGTHIAWTDYDNVLHFSKVGAPGVVDILGGREAIFDSGWMYYIAPYGNGEALFRVKVGDERRGITPEDLDLNP